MFYIPTNHCVDIVRVSGQYFFVNKQTYVIPKIQYSYSITVLYDLLTYLHIENSKCKMYTTGMEAAHIQPHLHLIWYHHIM